MHEFPSEILRCDFADRLKKKSCQLPRHDDHDAKMGDGHHPDDTYRPVYGYCMTALLHIVTLL